MAKNFLDPLNKFKWFIEREELDSQTAKPTGEIVTSYYRYEVDFNKGMERYENELRSFGTYTD
jgi:hypothetical protein